MGALRVGATDRGLTRSQESRVTFGLSPFLRRGTPVSQPGLAVNSDSVLWFQTG